MCGNGNLQAPVLFFLPSGRLFLWLPEVPDSHPPLSIQRRFRCNPPAHFLSFPNGNTRNAPDSFPLPLCKNSADKVLHTENDLLTKKKELESKIATKEEEIRTLKARLSNIVRQHEFATVQDFYTAFYTAQRAFDAYQKERSKWEEAYGEEVTPKFETIHDKIKRYQEKSDNQNANRPYQSKDKGAR